MKDLLILAADGTEEVECLMILDFARRAGLTVDLASIEAERKIRSSHGVVIDCDARLAELDPADYRALFCPGGLPGAKTISESPQVQDLVKQFHLDGRYVFAVCAGPLILKTCGLSASMAGTCYPSFKDELGFSQYHDVSLVRDANVITAQGLAATPALGAYIVEILADRERAETVSKAVLWPDLLSDAHRKSSLHIES
ncbi:MAG: DJ-1/PfpI family protein [Eubacteriales bacterium]|nr:DJ-1/PfpI family protein [Eubacteriales bacterium]